jgi:hypothetical protein
MHLGVVYDHVNHACARGELGHLRPSRGIRHANIGNICVSDVDQQSAQEYGHSNNSSNQLLHEIEFSIPSKRDARTQCHGPGTKQRILYHFNKGMSIFRQSHQQGI